MAKNKLNISIFQLDTKWEDVDSNLKNIEKNLGDISDGTDIVILPEMFNTGFTMNKLLAEDMSGRTVQSMIAWARDKNIAITGSICFREKDKIYNRLIWCDPAGSIYTYDKRHLFRMGEESEHYSSGNEIVTIDYQGWKIRPFICYDLRFPVWSRNVGNSYDVLVNVANWPEVRREAFITLLKARAIENLSYAVGVNRVGKDGMNIKYSGDSLVLDPKGKCLLGPLPAKEFTESISLDYQELINFRKKFPAWKDADDFRLLLD